MSDSYAKLKTWHLSHSNNVIGLHFDDMRYDETKKQFLDRITEALRKAFDGATAKEIVDGGYDG